MFPNSDNQIPRVAPVRPSRLLWVPLVAGALGYVLINGWPHLLWNFTYRGDWDHRFYTRCVYIGRYTQVVQPVDGACPYVRFFKETGRG